MVYVLCLSSSSIHTMHFFCIIWDKRREWVPYPFFAFDATSHRRNVAIWRKRKRTGNRRCRCEWGFRSKNNTLMNWRSSSFDLSGKVLSKFSFWMSSIVCAQTSITWSNSWELRSMTAVWKTQAMMSYIIYLIFLCHFKNENRSFLWLTWS